MTEFGSFDNSTCKRVLDLLKPGDLTLGKVVIKRVAVVELGVNNARSRAAASTRIVDHYSSSYCSVTTGTSRSRKLARGLLLATADMWYGSSEGVAELGVCWDTVYRRIF